MATKLEIGESKRPVTVRDVNNNNRKWVGLTPPSDAATVSDTVKLAALKHIKRRLQKEAQTRNVDLLMTFLKRAGIE